MGSVFDREVLILGGGISGLSVAHFLLQKHPSLQITLLERADRLGGVIHTDIRSGCLFERGPRTFLLHPHSWLLRLIREVGLEAELLLTSPNDGGRFLWHEGALQSLASRIPWRALLRAFCHRSPAIEDESIYDFAVRRFNAKVADELFDPLTLGIYAGDIRRLSLRSCFPKIRSWDQGQSSWFEPLQKLFHRSRLFTIRGGMSQLIETLRQKLPIEIVYRQEVKRLSSLGEKGVEVEVEGGYWRGRQVISALPLAVVQKLTGAFEGVPSQSLWTVNVAYEGVDLPRGYGYLVPSREKESLMGMIWDSSLFPQQGKSPARATAFLRGDEVRPLEVAVDAARRHLGLRSKPFFAEASLFIQAIPQFEVGYEMLKQREMMRLATQFPALFFAGNYWRGASVESCIEQAMHVASSI